MPQHEPRCTEMTIFDNGDGIAVPNISQKECCLVQIYPTDVVDGMSRLSDESVTIGRDERCDVSVNDSSVSRQHACIELTNAGYRLSDLGSTNGTFVNENKIESVVLEGGERIRFGSYIFKFLSADSIETRYHETVYDAMTRDGLTNAFNKSYLIDALGYELARSRRCGRPISLMMLDIDHFKQVNDTYGHLVGDEVLKEFCRRLTSVTRGDDLLCRYGGEEFAIVLGETQLADAVELAERCRQVIQAMPFATSAGELTVSVSIGVAVFRPDDVDADANTLLQSSDVQLYRAKNGGRNRVCWEGDHLQ